MGTSPAVLTETVWGLAHQSEPVVPDEVVVLAARDGADVSPSAECIWPKVLHQMRIRRDGNAG